MTVGFCALNAIEIQGPAPPHKELAMTPRAFLINDHRDRPIHKVELVYTNKKKSALVIGRSRSNLAGTLAPRQIRIYSKYIEGYEVVGQVEVVMDEGMALLLKVNRVPVVVSKAAPKPKFTPGTVLRKSSS